MKPFIVCYQYLIWICSRKSEVKVDEWAVSLWLCKKLSLMSASINYTATTGWFFIFRASDITVKDVCEMLRLWRDTHTEAINCICVCLERAWVSIISREMIRVDPACNQIVKQPPPALCYIWVTTTHMQAVGVIRFHFDVIHTDTRLEHIGNLCRSFHVITF